MVHLREAWRGYLWQGLFPSCLLDGGHALAAACYIELNPGQAGAAARDWRQSSAHAQLRGTGDDLARAGALGIPAASSRELLGAVLTTRRRRRSAAASAVTVFGKDERKCPGDLQQYVHTRLRATAWLPDRRKSLQAASAGSH